MPTRIVKHPDVSYVHGRNYDNYGYPAVNALNELNSALCALSDAPTRRSKFSSRAGRHLQKSGTGKGAAEGSRKFSDFRPWPAPPVRAIW